ncbi:hypothetical protein AC579_2241 [Pseudocercospora musae]|uniref:Uncharacterized protein n=1 Tax=Pseudocercospora musae TaxID=113226 RepID=A0A139IV93_9PEZI|nr:hypothetical protein AC579_2241 [Pseudocercospora musae]
MTNTDDNTRRRLVHDRETLLRRTNEAALAALEACKNSPYKSIASTPISTNFATPASKFREPYEHNGDARTSATPVTASQETHERNTSAINQDPTGPYKVYTFVVVHDESGKRGTEKFLNGTYITLEQATTVAEEVAHVSLNYHTNDGPCTVDSTTTDAGLRSYGIRRGQEYIEEVAVILQRPTPVAKGRNANESLTTNTNGLRTALRCLPRTVLFLLQLLFDLHITLKSGHEYLQRMRPRSSLVATADGFLWVIMTVVSLALMCSRVLGRVMTFSSSGARSELQNAYLGAVTLSSIGMLTWFMGWVGGVMGLLFALLLCARD